MQVLRLKMMQKHFVKHLVAAYIEQVTDGSLIFSLESRSPTEVSLGLD